MLDDGSFWVVKFSGAGPGTDALLAELVANCLGRAWGLPIPETMPVVLDSSVERAGTDEFWDVLAASEGWNLAIKTVPNAVNVVPDTTLPRSTLESIAAFDALMVNWDRTGLSRNLLRDEAGELWWIDHGSCRFLHKLATRQRPALPSTHFLYDTSLAIERVSLPVLERARVEPVLRRIPDPWLANTDVDRGRLGEQLLEYLHRAAAW